MIRHRLLLVGLVGLAGLITACTYKEYNTYNEVRGADAGSTEQGGGASGAGQGGAAGSAGVAGAGGSSGQTGVAGAAGLPTDPDCTGCLRLTMSSRSARNLRLEFPDVQNLSEAQMTWRVRVRDFTGDVSMNFYAQSGDSVTDNMALSYVPLSNAAGWQEIGADLSTVPAFSPPLFSDAGGLNGGAGAGFDAGFPFDKAEVERVGVILAPNVPDGVFTPLTLEIDSVSFSGHPDLNATFASSDAGFTLVDADGAVVAGATLTQVND